MMKGTRVTTPTDLTIEVRREFNAPREVVWDAMSKPELLKRWLTGPPGWEMTECEEDARPGGTFRWTWSHPENGSFSMTGVYREVVPPERSVRTEVFTNECVPGGGEQLATLVLTDLGARTGLTITLLYASKEARDSAVASGMEHGMAASYDRLERVLDLASV